jgi:hypothetical protein
MKLSTTMTEYSPGSRRVAPLTVVLGTVFVFFCAILVFVFIATKRANPVMLDPQGRPVNSHPGPANGGSH